jgi:hypothetical protein
MKRKKKEKLIITNTFKKLGDRGEKKGAGRRWEIEISLNKLLNG